MGIGRVVGLLTILILPLAECLVPMAGEKRRQIAEDWQTLGSRWVLLLQTCTLTEDEQYRGARKNNKRDIR